LIEAEQRITKREEFNKELEKADMKKRSGDRFSQVSDAAFMPKKTNF